jgi:hypothetical protein
MSTAPKSAKETLRHRGIKSGQLRAQLLVVLGLDASFSASAIKALKPGMTECLDHAVLYPDRIQDVML